MPTGNKDPHIIVAELAMERTVHDNAFLLVEGFDDVRFWGARKHSSCSLVDGEGKLNVLGAIGRLNDLKFTGVLGLVDEDYDGLVGRNLHLDNLVAISPHDMECLLCQSPALDVVLAEFGDPSKISTFEALEGVDVRTALVNRAGVFGRLRWAAEKYGMGIRLSPIDIPRFVNVATWQVNDQELIRTVGSNSEAELRKCIAQLPDVEPWRVARGHDVLEILRIGLSEVLGNPKRNTKAKDIASVLRAAADTHDLQQTKLWQDMRSWEEDTPPYLVLPRDD